MMIECANCGKEFRKAWFGGRNVCPKCGHYAGRSTKNDSDSDDISNPVSYPDGSYDAGPTPTSAPSTDSTPSCDTGSSSYDSGGSGGFDGGGSCGGGDSGGGF